eukprot:10842052-Ditylum_brightwellii.AAC.1
MGIKGRNNGNNLGSSSSGANGANKGAGGGTAEGGGADKESGKQSWKFHNLDNNKTMEQNGRTWK